MLACMHIWEEPGAGGMIWSLWRTLWFSFCGAVSHGKAIRYGGTWVEGGERRAGMWDMGLKGRMVWRSCDIF
jgi:hypothetical protein